MFNLQSKKYYLLSIALCLVGVISVAYYYFFSDFSVSAATQYIYIDDDDSADSVFFKLSEVGSPHGSSGVRTLLRHSGYANHVRPGRYAVEPSTSIFTLFRHIKNGQQSPMMLTIPEARTMPRLAALLAQKIMLDSATLADAFTDSATCARLGRTPETMAALFVPNSYEVYWDITLPHLLERMSKEHDAFWNDSRRAQATALGLSPDEVATVASIVDEETAATAEKPMIAGLYLNRLKAGMPLQADPTVRFAIGDFSIHRIYKGMLSTPSPYNTYKHEGLPPGPIKIASIKGIDAVLNRAPHDYLYMCANPDFSGTHNFARTYAEHQQNAQRYAKALNERGIK